MAKIEESVKKYLDNRIGTYRFYDPERGALWGHSTTLDCAVDVFADGNLKSTKKLLLDGADLRGKVLNRPKRLTAAYQSAYWMENGPHENFEYNQELAKKFIGTPLNELTERQRKAILEPCATWETPSVDNYISGAIGRVISGYSGDKKVGFIFSLNKLKKDKKIIDVINEGFKDNEISRAQYLFKFMLTDIGTSETSESEIPGGYSAFELNIIEKDNSPGVLSANKGLFLISENHYPEFKDKLAKKIKQTGKHENCIKNALDRTYSFNGLFENPDQAAGWLSNTPEGKEILRQKGIDLAIPDFSKSREFQDFLETRTSQIANETDNMICHNYQLSKYKKIVDYQTALLKKIEDAYVGLGYSRKNSRKKIIEGVENADYHGRALPFIKREMGIKERKSPYAPVVLTAADVFG